MRTVIVSLISEHTIPNYLFIKDKEGECDKLLFVSTEEMELKGKTAALKRTINKPEMTKMPPIIVSDDTIQDVIEKLEDKIKVEKTRFLVNLTCGTKVMSLGVYIFFSRLNASFFYLPIGKNLLKDLSNSTVQSIKYRMNIREYLSLYKLNFECDKKFAFSEKHTQDLFEQYKKVRFNRWRLACIRDAQSFKDAIEKSYYSGSWFEEYVYSRVKKELNLNDSEIAKNVKIYRSKKGSENNDNEIDLIFIQNNKLSIVECKVSMAGYPESNAKKTVDAYLYKLAAVSKDFGLVVDSYLFTLHNFNRYSEEKRVHIEKRRRVLGIKSILNSSSFEQKKLGL